MASLSTLTEAHQQPSIGDEDFEVIGGGLSINPYEMSLPPHPAPEATLTSGQLAQQKLAEVGRRFADMQADLACQKELLARLVNSAKTQSSSSNDCRQCQCARQELQRLQNRQEEWQQTADDYLALKNQYNLLANTKERLEAERSELLLRLQRNDEAKETTEGSSDVQNAAGRAADSTDGGHESQGGKDDSDNYGMESRIRELEELLQAKTAEFESLTSSYDQLKQEHAKLEEKNSQSEARIGQLSEKVAELTSNLQTEQNKLCEAEIRYRDELADLCQTSRAAQRVEALRKELHQRQQSELQLRHDFEEANETMNDILRECEKVRGQHDASEAALAESSRQLEESAAREMQLQDKLDKVRETLACRVDDHRVEVRTLREELSEAQQLHQKELETERQYTELRAAELRKVEAQFEEQAAEINRLRQREAELSNLCTENDRTINDIFASTEDEKRTVQERMEALAEQLRQETDKCAAAEAQSRRLSEELENALTSATNLQLYADSLQCQRKSAERQLADCRVKCNEAVDLANRLREQLANESEQARNLNMQLTALQTEHLSVRSKYTEIEHSLTDTMCREQDWHTRAVAAEANMSEYSRAMEENRAEFERQQREKESLRQERDRLIEQVQKVRRAFDS